jgi:hypothetical protein
MMHLNPLREAERLPRLQPLALTALRLVWVLVFILYAAVYVAEVPVLLAQYNHLTGLALRMGFQEWSSGGMRTAIQDAGLTIEGLAGYRLALKLVYTIGFVALGLLIFWRRSDEWIGLFTSGFLITFGFIPGYVFNDANLNPVLAGSLRVMVGLPWFGFFLFYFIYPNGRFVPRWTVVWSLPLLFIMVTASLYASPDQAPAWFVPFVFISFGLAVWAQIYRYVRAADGLQRAQVRWILLAAGVIAGLEIMGQGLVPAMFPALAQETATGLTYGLMLETAVLLFLILPFALTIAILRYRLWDIDLLIRRTLVYAVLTALLALAYLGSILALQSIVGVFAGGGKTPLVTVLSTLLIAALFVPLRRWVQAIIDRRFFRRKYDAARTVAAFGAALRDETNLEQLSAHLTAVVDEAMQPESVGLWLAPGAKAKSGA